jgi:hypothetical protein
MGGDITLDDKQKWALYFAGILRARGFNEAAKSLEETYSPFYSEKQEKQDWFLKVGHHIDNLKK